MEYLDNTSSLFSLCWLIKAIFLDLENIFSRVDSFLQSASKFLSTKLWNILGSDKAHQVSISSEPCSHLVRRPVRSNRSPELVEKMSIPEINLVISRLGVGGAMEVAGDENKNKLYGEDDFLTLFDEEEPSFEEIKETFEVFDWNKDGFIDCSELRRVLCALGFRQGCGLEDCKRMIQDFDSNGDGLIDFREFVVFMEKCFSNS